MLVSEGSRLCDSHPSSPAFLGEEVANGENVLTARQVATILQVSARTVLNYVHTGKLRAIRLGGNGPWRVYASSVSRLLGISPSKPGAKSRDVQDRIDLALGILGISQHQEHVDP